MDCLTLKVKLEAKNGQRLGPPTPIEAVHESLTGRAIGTEDRSSYSDFPLVPFRIDLSSDKTSVEVSRTSWTIHTEKSGGISAKAHWIRELLSRVKSKRYLGDADVSTVSVDSAWISPFAGRWEDIFGQYSRAFFSPAAFPAEAMDVSALFDAKLAAAEVHVQSGPMTSEQLLQEWVRFLEPEQAPNLLLFVLHSYRTSHEISIALPAGIDHAETEVRRLESVFQEAAL